MMKVYHASGIALAGEREPKPECFSSLFFVSETFFCQKISLTHQRWSLYNCVRRFGSNRHGYSGRTSPHRPRAGCRIAGAFAHRHELCEYSSRKPAPSLLTLPTLPIIDVSLPQQMFLMFSFFWFSGYLSRARIFHYLNEYLHFRSMAPDLVVSFCFTRTTPFRFSGDL